MSRGLGSIIFAVGGCAPCTLHVYGSVVHSLKEKTAWRHLTFLAVMAGALLNFAIGLVGYLSFTTQTQSNILSNFTAQGYDVFQILLVLHLLMYIPGDLIILKYNLVKLVSGKKSEDLPFYTNFLIVVIILAIILGTVLGAISSGQTTGFIFSAVLNITGGIGGSTLSFILPGLLYIKVFDNQADRSFHYTAYFVIIFGFIAMCTVILVIVLEPVVPAFSSENGPQNFIDWSK